MGEQGADQSITFDRAAEYYDRTRSLPADLMTEVTDVLVDELKGRGRTLEIGVGTGRVALPLHERGVELVGLDISRAMIDRLIETAGGVIPFPIALADATTVPLATNSIRAALAVHVFHLIPNWRRVLDELVRVMDNGGVLIADLAPWGGGEIHQVTEHWLAAAGLEKSHPGLLKSDELDEAMKARGARVRELDAIRGSRSRTYEEVIAPYEEGLFSITWRVSEEIRKEASEATRAWVTENLGNLNESIEEEIVIGLRAYDL